MTTQRIVQEKAVVREVVGAFRSADWLEDAITDLASSGWDKSEMSLLGQEGVFQPGIPAHGQDMHRAADEPEVKRSPVVEEEDVRQGRTLATSLAAVIAAFAASGATILTGGGALAAVVGAAAAGGGAAAAMNTIGRWISGSRSDFLRDQIDQGGILLWVKVQTAAQEAQASEILRRHGATDVHVHEIPAT
ncbi:MAG: hypothetical protein JNL04_01325 [Rhodospirillaceae bacterium]|nr:hypothetical protein [Rhodospirillaceae bacterium]